jgi:DNA-binding NarL/FixJ family response regulator
MAVLAEIPQPVCASILVVDTDLITLEHTRRAMRAAGYRVHIATQSEEANRLVRTKRIDVAIVDDVELAIAIRHNRPNVIRVLATASPSLESALRAINEAVVQGYLIKPYDDLALRCVLRNLLGLRDQRTCVPGMRKRLSPRLRQTLNALLTGASEKEIASHLGISYYTEHEYVKELFRRFNVSSRAELMAAVLKQ